MTGSQVSELRLYNMTSLVLNRVGETVFGRHLIINTISV
jgi:hypothetical protein